MNLTYTLRAFVLLIAWYALIASYLLLTSCVTPARVFNKDDLQDGNCYNSYGGQWGYCDVRPGDIK